MLPDLINIIVCNVPGAQDINSLFVVFFVLKCVNFNSSVVAFFAVGLSMVGHTEDMKTNNTYVKPVPRVLENVFGSRALTQDPEDWRGVIA